MRATLPSGDLIPLAECFIEIPSLEHRIEMKILPDISDTKSATYADETGIGRSFPFKNYSHSDNRSISWTCHFLVCKEGDQEQIMEHLRVLEACTYPMDEANGAPYGPPPICHLRCGRFLSVDGEICAVLKSYSVKADPTVPWDESGYVPYKLDVDLQFDTVHDNENLPGAERIVILGN